MNRIIQIIGLMILIGGAVFCFRLFRADGPWVVSYGIKESSVTISAVSRSRSFRYFENGNFHSGVASGVWKAGDKDSNITVVSRDETVLPGRIVFELAERRFDLSERGLFLVSEPKK